MGYRIENKSVDTNELRKLSRIATGKTGNVYRYRNDALKIFKEGEKPPIDEETARYLQGISTDRILMPKKLLFYNAAFRGYTLRLVTSKGTIRKIVSLDKDDVLTGIYALETDIEELSRRKILLNGISPENAIYNGRIYLSDPSKFTKFEISDTDELQKINKYQLQLLLIEMVSNELSRLNYTQRQVKHFREVLSLRDSDEDIYTFFDTLMDGEKNIKQLVKKMGL